MKRQDRAEWLLCCDWLIKFVIRSETRVKVVPHQKHTSRHAKKNVSVQTEDRYRDTSYEPSCGCPVVWLGILLFALCTSSYTGNSMQSSACSMFITMDTGAIHWSLSELDRHSPYCPYTDQLKARSHNPGFLMRYRPKLSLSDEPDDAIIWNVSGATAEVLYP